MHPVMFVVVARWTLGTAASLPHFDTHQQPDSGRLGPVRVSVDRPCAVMSQLGCSSLEHDASMAAYGLRAPWQDRFRGTNKSLPAALLLGLA